MFIFDERHIVYYIRGVFFPNFPLSNKQLDFILIYSVFATFAEMILKALMYIQRMQFGRQALETHCDVSCWSFGA